MRRFFAKPAPEPAPPPEPLPRLRAEARSAVSLAPGDLSPGLWWHLDSSAGLTGTWSSPRGRLVELETEVTAPAAFLALHLSLPEPDLHRHAWVGLVARTAAAEATTIRPCIRSGLSDGGFHDLFLPRQILSQSTPTDHHDLIAPAHTPDLPRAAPWRELILFLPSRRPVRWVLHDLRVLTA